MKKLLPYSLGVIIILLLLSCGKKKPEPPRIYRFSERSKVEWTDFRGYPEYFEKFDAGMSSGVHYEYTERIENGKLVLDFEVYSFFSQGNSWTKYKKDTPLLLKHEQYHYHISEIAARKLRRTFMGYSFNKNYEEEMFKHYCVNDAYLTVMQKDYDDQTHHSVVRTEQERWEKFVVQQMWELQGYANENFTVKTNVPMTQWELDAKRIAIIAEHRLK